MAQAANFDKRALFCNLRFLVSYQSNPKDILILQPSTVTFLPSSAIKSCHSFSNGPHTAPDNKSFGTIKLLDGLKTNKKLNEVNNDDVKQVLHLTYKSHLPDNIVCKFSCWNYQQQQARF
jgi:hypothetical protein